MNPAHRQLDRRVRFDWGPTGAVRYSVASASPDATE